MRKICKFKLSKINKNKLVSAQDIKIGSVSKSLRLTLIRLPEVNFPQNATLRMYVGCIQA